MSINYLTHQWATQKGLASSFFPEITSTNDVAKAEFSNTQDSFKLYLADHQTHGRGRYQRSWQNLSQGEILLSTWCFRSQNAPQPILTPLIGLALYKSLQAWQPLTLKDLRLKAPNDLYIENKKLSGLLIEVAQMGSQANIFIGLGLNALGSPQIDQATVSLNQLITDPRKDWNLFCDLLLQELQNSIQNVSEKSLTSQQQNELLKALNSGLPKDQQFLSVSPYCDLTNQQGTISWLDL